MPFSSFVGNSRCLGLLRSALRRGRVPPALLLAGPDAVGKKLLAQQLAMALNCDGSLEADWCGACRSCGLILAGTHPDVSLFEPEGQFVKIDQVRQLIREAVRNPFQGRMKVLIVDEAQQLHPAAANALLKTLEEPPPTTRIILVTSQPHTLLTTIRSRCQLVRFSPLSEADVASVLESRFGVETEEAKERARLSGGSLGKAVSLDLKRHLRIAEAAQLFLEKCLLGEGLKDVAETLARIAKEREDTEEWAGLLLLRLREAAHGIVLGGRSGKAGVELSLPAVEAMVSAVEGLRRGLDHNVNRTLALENLYLRCAEIPRQPQP